MKKRYFRSQNTGNLHESSNEYWLCKCPICEKTLYRNSYSDHEVVRINSNDVGFDLKIEYCFECNDYYVLII